VTRPGRAPQMLPIIQSGAQLRVNGNHKFRQGKYKEALEMYMQAPPLPRTARARAAWHPGMASGVPTLG
jgi:hypothetical protein